MPTTTAPADPDAKTSQQAFTDKLARLSGAGAAAARAPAAPPEEVRAGLPFEALKTLADQLGLTPAALTDVLGTSERTLSRRRRSGRLGPLESDRLWRLGHVYHLALEAFDGEADEARTWLASPKRALGDDSPIQHLDTEPGLRMVEQMLHSIEHTMPA